MPSTETKEDKRLIELAAINSRLKSILSFLKTKHTTKSLDAEIESASRGLGDHTPAFVFVDNVSIHGTRHIESLLRMTEAMEIKAEIGHADHAVDECTRLLERKVQLLKEIYSKS